MLFDQITLRNLLSFKDAIIDLKPLNILIGENTVGKSNFVEAIGLLQAAPSDLRRAILRGGGVRFWLSRASRADIATLRCRISASAGMVRDAIYEIEFAEEGVSGGLTILRESLAAVDGERYFLRTSNGLHLDPDPEYLASVEQWESVFASFKDPADKTPITSLGRQFSSIRIYRDFNTGPRSGSRLGTSTSTVADVLMDGGDNLAVVLQELDFHGVLGKLNELLRQLAHRIEEVKVRPYQGVATVFLRERGLSEPLPSSRMSDGTLKFLCLLAVLLHPDPPPFICIEEPEQGLHPDAIQVVAQVLREAAERTQLVVTTHSRELVDAFSDTPECVLVCERDEEDGTQCRRLVSSELDEWLEQYSLGALWRTGEIGGNRW